MRPSGTHVPRHTKKAKGERISPPPEPNDTAPRLSPPLGHTRQPSLASREPTTLEVIASKLQSQLPRPSFPSLGGSRSSGAVTRLDSDPSSALASDDEESFDQAKEYDMDESIVWSGWDDLDGKRLLLLAYRTGIQIWDATTLDSVHEVTNINGSSLGSVKCAKILPAPSPSVHDHHATARPLLALITVPEDKPASELLVYSLSTRVVVTRMPLPQAGFIEANDTFIAISSAQPPSIHILSAHTLSPIYKLSPPSDLSSEQPSYTPTAQAHEPPIFALSQRLLAFSSLPPSAHALRQGFRASVGYGQTNTQKHIQIEVANTARRVGEGVWGGVRALGGMAFGTERRDGAARGSIFSRSAPAASAVSGAFPSSSALFDTDTPPPKSSERRGSSIERSTTGYLSADLNPASGWITILDLKPILSSYPPIQVTHFSFNPSSPISQLKPITALSFSPSGSLLAAADGDGTVVKIFQPRPAPLATEGLASSSLLGVSPQTTPRMGKEPYPVASGSGGRRRGSETSNSSESPNDREVWHVYDLIRGVTRARVERIGWSRDTRWIAVGTAKGTLHLFAINPYGGKPDEDSHLEGRVRNVDELQPLSTTVSAILRFHVPKTSRPSLSPPSFTLLPLSAALTSDVLRPHSSPSTPTSGQLKRNSFTLSPAATTPTPSHTTTAFQDVLILNPATGKLTLRRCTVRPSPQQKGSPQGPNPSLQPSSPSRVSGLTNMMRAVTSGGATEDQITGTDSTIASWDIGREKGWPDVLPQFPPHPAVRSRVDTPRLDWPAQAELSTSSRSTSILPPPVYLSHQFTFFSLHEDWHALIRRSQFELPSTKFEVRKEVKISAYSGANSMSGSFIQGNQRPRETDSTFDEPIASAMHASLETDTSPAVIPSFPNAYKATTWGTAIPIRSVAAGLSDGVNEGLGKLKREIVKIGSPKKPSVLKDNRLQFDESSAVFAEEEYMSPPDEQERDGESSTGSNSGPSTLPADSEEWEAYSVDEAYNQAVDVDTQFDDVAVTGMMDEEQEARRAHAHAASRKRRTRRSK